MKDLGLHAEYVSINGIDQFLLHQKAEGDKPVLLFLHGGPGLAESVWSYYYQSKWSLLFTVVQWDQRGAGKTLKVNPQSIPTVDLLLEDLDEVVQYLKRKYNREQIIILGHSFGSFLGKRYLRRHPENVLYYIGVGQLVNIIENERIGYERLSKVLREMNHKRDLHKLEKLGEYPGKRFDHKTLQKLKRVRKLQRKNKVLQNVTVDKANIYRSSPCFELSDVLRVIKAQNISLPLMFELNHFDLFKQTCQYSIPVFYILGENDWHTPSVLASKYFQKIKAPIKKLFMIKDAGHAVMFDQPESFLMYYRKFHE